MLGLSPSGQQQALFSYHVNLEQRIPRDHPIRKLKGALDLDFVIPAVRDFYGLSGNVSADPRVIVKLMILLFYFNLPSERVLLEELPLRLDFLWFLGFDLDTKVPDHSVLSKARRRWGTPVFQELFVRSVEQCVQAGLVDGSLLHTDSTMVKANASKDSVVKSSPELVNALREAYQKLEEKLEVLPTPEAEASARACTSPEGPSAELKVAEPELGRPAPESTPSAVEPSVAAIGVVPAAAPAPAPCEPKTAGPKLPVNSTHISRSDPEARLSRSKNGLTDLNYKEHRLVDDTHGVITALEVTHSTVPDGTKLPGLVGQHQETTGFQRADLTVAGDHHYGTASNYLFCAGQGIRAHLADASANVEERGKFPPTQFVYEAATDRLRCPAGHHLVFHQHRPEEQLKVYLIADPALCGKCPLRSQCTQAKQGRSIRRHLEAERLAALLQEAKSSAAQHSRKRRQHVMEGSFADAANNHGSKRARWRGLWRQKIQSCLIAAMQNLRILIRHGTGRGGHQAAAALDLWIRKEVAELRRIQAPEVAGERIIRAYSRPGALRVIWSLRLSWHL